MDDTSKYLIHADIAADGVVERSDVVGAIFGQTEGLLGDDLDLRDLQQSSKVGRIDVQVDSENGQSHGTVTIASSLDKVETAILAASLETITRVGPCRATIEVDDIEDVRAAKRREVVERAKQLLTESFDDSVMDSREILDEVREAVRVEDITEYAGLPAGPHVTDSDAIIVVEGRADVLTLLKYGIKNAIAVEGTNVPDAVAELTAERTVTAFLDGDRGGELILRELAQVGDVDHAAFAPTGKSVEDLARHEVMSALRDKVDYATLVESGDLDTVETEDAARPRTGSPATTESPAAATPDGERVGTDSGHAGTGVSEHTDGPTPASDGDTTVGAVQSADGATATTDSAEADATVGSVAAAEEAVTEAASESAGEQTLVDTAESAADATPADEGDSAAEPSDVDAEQSSEAVAAATETDATDESAETDATDESAESEPQESETGDEPTATLRGHVSDVIDGERGVVRLLDGDLGVLEETAAGEAFAALEGSETVPFAVVLDGPVSQRLLDVAAQRGVDHLIGESTEQYVKKPVSVRVRTADQLRAS
ncbi:DNA primase DnaG [Salinigranum sp.]|uniref:DNA primase DnaG n=1 Tax=Salinigranum sp. TaxID=1966351 RepID=UPI00356AF892